MSRIANRHQLAAAVTVLATALVLLIHVPAAPAAPPPPIAVPDDGLNTLWSAYGDQGGHWTGGDRTASVPLPDGRVAWLFSDSYLGTINQDHSRPASTPMVHNAIVVESGGSLGPTLLGGVLGAPRSLVEDPASALTYWVGDGVVEGATLKVLYNLVEQTGGGPLDVQARGTALATFSLPDLRLTELRTLPLGTSIAWGSELLDEGGYTYIYGSEHNADGPKFAHLARVAKGSLGGAWQFVTSSGSSPRTVTVSPRPPIRYRLQRISPCHRRRADSAPQHDRTGRSTWPGTRRVRSRGSSSISETPPMTRTARSCAGSCR